MEEWKERKVSELIQEISMGPFGSNIKVDNFVDSGVPVLNGSNLQGYKLNEDSFNYVSEEKADSLGKASAHRGDIVITHRGTLGQIIYIPQNSKFNRYVISQSQFRLKLKSEIVRPDYFVYFFHTRIGQHKILMNASQVGVPALARPTTTFKEVSIPIPPLSVQDRIMAILLCIDDKIELNHKINSNLEEQAKALFKSWFIDFEPFKGGKFVESEFGMIPERWNMMSFESFISESQDKAIVGTYPAYSVTNNGITPRTEKFKKQLSKVTSKEKVLRKDDLVFGMSRQILNWGIMQDEIGSVSSAYHVYKIDKGKTNPTYLRYFIKGYESYFRDLIGTAAREGQSLDKGALMNKKLLVPSKDILRSFIQHVTTIENTLSLFKSQCRLLSMLRDTLLPRLLSGEIEVK